MKRVYGCFTLAMAICFAVAGNARAEGEAVWKEPVTGMEFLSVPGGCYTMGSPVRDRDQQPDESPRHKVCVNDFYLGRYEVTQETWQKVMGANPSHFHKGGNYPVEQVSWEDARDFIARLQEMSKGNRFRLPTEAEWEYAARSEPLEETKDENGQKFSVDKPAGHDVRYAGHDQLDPVGWCRSNSGGASHPVGAKQPNGLGFFDMSGNVWEWVGDWYGDGYYSSSPEKNPVGPPIGSNRVMRGGSWSSEDQDCRAVNRASSWPGNRHHNLGFRLLLKR